MLNPINLAMQMLQNNPNIANNPQAQHMLEVIQSGNSEEGQKIANNLLQTYGVSKDDALKQAKGFFNLQ